MKKHWTIYLIFVCFTFVGAYLWSARDQDSQPWVVLQHQSTDATNELQSKIAALTSQVLKLTSELEAVRIQVHSESQPLDFSRVGTRVETDDADPGHIENGEQVLIEQMDEILAAETEPREWSIGAEESVANAVASKALEGTYLTGVVCRDSLCRVSLSHDDEAAQQSAALNLPVTPPFNTDGMIQFVGDEENPNTIVYIAREGERLPDFPD